ncbi:hypothetical protein [Synechococcus sp. WH 7805]|uniref:hypothetical protein n=1 Tax=Synechococcus sp. (strain WH7805) TaxID=59931 RepID=UPI0018DC39DC|nr:hypothetical protein [Synechococcus sp. WH 7805]
MGFQDSGPHPAADTGLRPEGGSGLVRNSAEHVPHGIQHQPHRLMLIGASLAEFTGNHPLGQCQMLRV